MEENQRMDMISVNDINALKKEGKTRQEIFTTIENEKTLLNLENVVDFKLNDCKGEKIIVKDVLVKKLTKKLDEPEVDENGEIVKEYSHKFITILVDDEGNSYVTGSASFTISLMNVLQKLQNAKQLMENGEFILEICEKQAKNSQFKSLSFKLI
jgi:hypothetical protein